MLIDIFARRYKSIPLRSSFDQRDRGLLVQAFRILAEDFYPYYLKDKEWEEAVKFWTNLHNLISRELGLTELSPLWYSYTTKWNGQDISNAGKHTLVKVCETWLLQGVTTSPDQHVKDRLSLIELGFREREAAVARFNAGVPKLLNKQNEYLRKLADDQAAAFRSSVEELNARFRQADYPLNYHNGFIQLSTDDLLQREVETPFWSLLSDAAWQNVDRDMKEALDLRDSDGRDPSFYAARALESTIKIISDKKGWTHGGEKGAHNFIDNLASKANAFMTPWEAELIKGFFTHVRNPLGHGPGTATMPTLSRQQTEWAIEFSMSWIKNLIRRM